jgi:hypothetical protein
MERGDVPHRRRLRRSLAHLLEQTPTVIHPPPAANLLPKRIHTEADDVDGSTELGLTAAEISFFKEHGFLAKRQLIPAEGLAVGLAAFWAAAAKIAPQLRRDDPCSWVDAGDRWQSSTPEADGGRGPHRLDSNSKWRFHGLGTGLNAAGPRCPLTCQSVVEKFLDSTSRHPRMLAQVWAFTGNEVMIPRRNRGIYAIFPRNPQHTTPGFGPHLDSHTFQICGMLYLDDVLPNAGGTTYWSGSHKLLYPAFEQEYNFLPSDSYGEAHQRARESCVPVEVTGRAGDVVFTHHRTLHSGGANLGSKIRMAVPCDFQKVRWPGEAGRIGSGPVMALVETKGGEVVVGPNEEIAKFTGGGGRAEPPFPSSRAKNWWTDNTEWAPEQPTREDMWWDWRLLPVRLKEPKR